MLKLLGEIYYVERSTFLFNLFAFSFCREKEACVFLSIIQKILRLKPGPAYTQLYFPDDSNIARRAISHNIHTTSANRKEDQLINEEVSENAF